MVKRFTLIKLMTVIAMMGIVMGFIVSSEQYRFNAIHRRMDVELAFLSARRPREVPPAVWNEAVMWTKNACGAVCFSTKHICLREFQLFLDELKEKLSGEVDLETLDWIWDRLALTG